MGSLAPARDRRSARFHLLAVFWLARGKIIACQYAMGSSSVTVVRIPVGRDLLMGDLRLPLAPVGLVVFAHGSGSSRHSTRNQSVARTLGHSGLATLLVDLLTEDEEAIDTDTRSFRFDIPLLGRRLVAILDWVGSQPTLKGLPVGLFGASTGGAAALIAAAERPARVAAVVSRGGRPDLAAGALPRVAAPTLLLVGGRDEAVIALNEEARREMRAEVALEIVPGATHLFEEPGALEHVAVRSAEWFVTHCSGAARREAVVAGTAPDSDGR